MKLENQFLLKPGQFHPEITEFIKGKKPFAKG